MPAKTSELPGVEGEGVAPKRIKRLDNAIEKWRGFVEQRMALTENEVAARDNVLAIMHTENLKRYPYWISDDEVKLLVIDSSEKLKLKKADSEEPAETEPEED